MEFYFLPEVKGQEHVNPARAYHRVLKLARTIADLAGAEGIALAHPSPSSGQALAEALQYRPRGVIIIVVDGGSADHK